MRVPSNISADNLDRVMEYDHVIRVRTDLAVEDVDYVHAPESRIGTDDDGQVLQAHEAEWRDGLESQGWSVMNGYSGQWSYRGPIMHTSEYVGGRMAQDILAEPGFYVKVRVEILPRGEEEGDADEGDADEEPAGWAVLYREMSMSLAEAKDKGIIRGWEHAEREAAYGHLGLHEDELCHVNVWRHGHEQRLAFLAGVPIGRGLWARGLSPDGVPLGEREPITGESTGPYRHLVFSSRDNDPRGGGAIGEFATIEQAQRVPSGWFRAWIIDGQGRHIMTGSHPGRGGTGRRWVWREVEPKPAFPRPAPEVQWEMTRQPQHQWSWKDRDDRWCVSVPVGPDEADEALMWITGEIRNDTQRDSEFPSADDVTVKMTSTAAGRRVYRETWAAESTSGLPEKK